MIIHCSMIGCGLVVIASALMPATAIAESQEQMPLIGTWRTEMPGPNGLELIVFFQFLPNGYVAMNGYKRGFGASGEGALAFQETGTYRFVGGILQFIFTDYEPKNEVIQPPDLFQPKQVQIQFVNENQFVTSDGATYVRVINS